MSNLQIGLVVFGVVLVAAVALYNLVQERRARSRAEKAFGARPPDALFEPAAERREPTLGKLPEGFAPVGREDAQAERGLATTPPDSLEAEAAPEARVSSRIDSVAVILADDPVTLEQLQPLLEGLRTLPAETHVEGIVDEQWHPVEESPRTSWRELRVGLQLASRKGALGEAEIEAFNALIADFAASVNAVSQREAPAAAAERARELDLACADADIEVAVNVVGQYGATFALSRVKSLALENGLSETASGELVRFAPGGNVAFSIRRFGDAARAAATYTPGLTFALDVPQVADAPAAMAEMVRVAGVFAATLGGQLVDDNRKPLTEAGIASIRRTLERVFHSLEEQGIPAGSALARRLFS